MKTAICTISTQSHLFKSQALFESVLKYCQTDVFCLVTDEDKLSETFDFEIHFPSDLKDTVSAKIQKKYDGNHLRWALKPVYLKFLLDLGYEAVIYCDNDIYFYGSPDFLFEKLIHSYFLLTPHFYEANPERNQNWFEANFRVGLYNAGFIGVSQQGVSILNWWSECCAYNMKKSFWRGMFDDQKYLDLLPVLFDGVEILKNKGCNLAGWNYHNYELFRDGSNRLTINGDELVFIHFAALSISEFSQDGNALGREYESYLTSLKKIKEGFEFTQPKFEPRNISSFFYYLRWSLVRKLEQLF